MPHPRYREWCGLREDHAGSPFSGGLSARAFASDRHASGLRTRRVRRLHDFHEWSYRALVPHARGAGGWRPYRHHRRSAWQGWHTPSAAADFSGKLRLAVRYCTPGMLITAIELLQDNPNPTEREVREALSGNICRCSGYQAIVEAVLIAARQAGA